MILLTTKLTTVAVEPKINLLYTFGPISIRIYLAFVGWNRKQGK